MTETPKPEKVSPERVAEMLAPSDSARREGKKRFPFDMAAANAFHRAAMGWTPPDRVRLTREQRKAVAEGHAYALNAAFGASS